MEEVWRSYGPLEPIGPGAGRSGSRRRGGAIAAGVLGVCALGAAAGLYLKPDLERQRPETPAAAERTGEPSDRLAEAQDLQAELQLALGEGPSSPAVVAGPAGGPITAALPPSTYSPPARGIEPPTVRERAAAVYRAIVAPSAPTTQSTRPPLPAPRVSAPVRPAPELLPRRYEAAAPRPIEAAPRQVLAPPRREAPVEAVAPPPPVIAPAPPPRGPSFDCRTVRSAAEDMVCSDPRLAALDRQVAAELMGAMAAGHSPDLLLRDQNDWLARRDRAAPDPRAVADAYSRRIGQLRSMQ